MERELNDDSRIFTSAAGAYAGTVAEHALALMLAGARRLHECARATEWESGSDTLRRLDRRDPGRRVSVAP